MLVEQQKTIELIMTESDVEEKNYKEYKHIHIASDIWQNKYMNKVIYQSYDHLKHILNQQNISQD